MNHLTEKKKEMDATLQELLETASSSAKSNRLKAFNKICEGLVKKSIPLKITLVVRQMEENGYKMSQQSVYNKHEDGNPYRTLFDLWSEYDEIKHTTKKITVSAKTESDNFIDEDELGLIQDPALRYRISLMFGELKGLKKQNDLLKQVKEMNIIQSVPEYMVSSKGSSEMLLDDYEVGILKEFVLSNSNISFDDDGALISKLPIKKGQTLSNQGLKDALIKVLRSYKINL